MAEDCEGSLMAYANDRGEACSSSMERAGDDHIHRCEFAAEHTDWDRDGSHQCECGTLW